MYSCRRHLPPMQGEQHRADSALATTSRLLQPTRVLLFQQASHILSPNSYLLCVQCRDSECHPQAANKTGFRDNEIRSHQRGLDSLLHLAGVVEGAKETEGQPRAVLNSPRIRASTARCRMSSQRAVFLNELDHFFIKDLRSYL